MLDFSSLSLPSGLHRDHPPTKCHLDGTEQVPFIYSLLHQSTVIASPLITEVVGAVVSVLMIWVITGVLFYEAVLRVMHPERFKIDADIMLITACVGVYVNVL